jgi:peptidyl-prolyl cis-trans isomerase D
MFGTIRKHQTWLWVVVATITIVSFVVFFNPSNRGAGSNRGPANFGSINGERISEDDFYSARNEVLLQYYFMSGGSWLDNETDAKKAGFDLEQRIYARLLLIQKEEQLGIHVSSEMAGQFATDMLRQFGSPAAFVEKVLQPRRLQMSDLDRFVRHELGIQELISTIGLSGKLVTPQEAQSLYVREHEELSTQAAFFDGSNYLASASAPADAISQFYTNHIPDYEIPERVQVSYVKFGYSNRLAKAEQEMTNLTEIVESNIQRLGSNYVHYGKTVEEAKAKIREEILMRAVLPEVRKEAIAFAGPLAEPTNAPTLEELAKTNGLTVSATPPFDIASGPTNLDVGSEFTRVAFSLSAERPVPEPIITRDGVYVISFKNRLPREIPPLEKIRDQVLADYKYSQALTLARKSGADFARTLTNGLAQGKTFDALCAEVKVKPVTLPPFSISTRSLPEAEDHIPLNGSRTRMGLKDIAFSTMPGKASGFHETSDGGIILYVKAKLPLDEAKMKSELPAFISYVRQNRSREAFDAWFRKEADKGLRDTPLFHRQEAPPTAKS